MGEMGCEFRSVAGKLTRIVVERKRMREIGYPPHRAQNEGIALHSLPQDRIKTGKISLILSRSQVVAGQKTSKKIR
jgi:hypothetical protein